MLVGLSRDRIVLVDMQTWLQRVASAPCNKPTVINVTVHLIRRTHGPSALSVL